MTNGCGLRPMLHASSVVVFLIINVMGLGLVCYYSLVSHVSISVLTRQLFVLQMAGE